MPSPDLPLSALPPMPLASNPPHHKYTSSTITIENNIAYPFRLRHSYGQTADYNPNQHNHNLSTTSGLVSGPRVAAPSKPFPAPSDRPDSAVLSGPHCARFSALSLEGLEDEIGNQGIPRPFPPAHFGHRSSARLSYTSGSSTTLSRAHFASSLPASPSSADFPIIPSRPPLRPTVSFGGVSQISYYSNMSADRDLEARSLSLARAEEGEGRKAKSLSRVSLRKARSFACMWPEARKKGRSRV